MNESNFHIFHRYWMNNKIISGHNRQAYGNVSFSMENGHSGSTLYKCRLIPDDPNHDNGNFYVMKVISYSKESETKKRKGQYSPINPYTKTFQQIETQFLVLQMLNKCHRIAKLQEVIHENPKREDDKQFFYHFLQKPKNKGQRYVCFITEYCNQDTLDVKIQKNKGGFSKEDVIVYSAQILEGLFELKKKKIIHRDLRLCNILLHNGEVRFSDFDTAFIGGKSTWKDVKNGIDIETSPPEIIQLASKPDEDLMRYDPEELYQRQEKSDNYFFGLALFKMIYGYNYEKINKSTLENIISEMINVSDHSPKLLELMAGCLQERADKRIDFYTLYTEFRKIEKNYYFEKRDINKIYLSDEPLVFASYKSLNKDLELLMKMNDSVAYTSSVPPGWNQLDFQDQLIKTSNNRMTCLFKNKFQKYSMEKFWRKAEEDKQQQKVFNQKMENFIKTFSIRSYYYECLYKATLSIDIKNIKSKQFKMTVKNSKKILEQEMTIVLAFLFKLLFNTPFKRDRLYDNQNLPYEARKLFNNMIKSDIIQNKMNCYLGKSRIFDYESSQITKMIKQFQEKLYEKSSSFDPIYSHVLTLLDKIEVNMNKLLKDTIIKLKHAYEISGTETSCIKEILFTLIVLQQQKLETLRKNDIIMIWQCLTPLISEECQLDKVQVDMFLEQFKEMYAEEEDNAARERDMLTVTLWAISQKMNKSKQKFSQEQEEAERQEAEREEDEREDEKQEDEVGNNNIRIEISEIESSNIESERSNGEE